MKLTFWGAARQVTGSMHLLELEDDYRILIDCGSDLDRARDIPETPYPGGGIFPFEPSQINVVLLTHAHIDHSGNLPNLIREGFEGQVVCTPPTYQLTELLLADSASLNQKKLKNATDGGSKRRSKKRSFLVNTREMYLQKQVNEALKSFSTVSFNRKFRIRPGLEVTYIPAGHLLGAASIVLDITENGTKKSICFSGDLGRKNYPLLVDPQRIPRVDYLICESTYGARQHVNHETPEEALADVIRRTCVDQPGRLIIPAFSVGRTQALLYTLNKLYTEHDFPRIRVFSDSPLALGSTKVYEKHIQMLNADAQDFYGDHKELFDFENFTFLSDMKASKAVSNHAEPCIIVSSSGMVQGGRVEHHVEANISNPYCTILMIGFAAEGTLGARLLNGQNYIEIRGKKLDMLANVERIDVFSGHGDCEDLVEFVRWQAPEQLKQVFLVHGEYESMLLFQSRLAEEGYPHVEIPKKGQSYQL
ncbi:MAG: MBL fold metallo-hydrolase [Ferruginibacter sp.]|nr:MBL fold metallo-hydrolase [Cytophagales bacterium]